MDSFCANSMRGQTIKMMAATLLHLLCVLCCMQVDIYLLDNGLPVLLQTALAGIAFLFLLPLLITVEAVLRGSFVLHSCIKHLFGSLLAKLVLLWLFLLLLALLLVLLILLILLVLLVFVVVALLFLAVLILAVLIVFLVVLSFATAATTTVVLVLLVLQLVLAEGKVVACLVVFGIVAQRLLVALYGLGKLLARLHDDAHVVGDASQSHGVLLELLRHEKLVVCQAVTTFVHQCYALVVVGPGKETVFGNSLVVLRHSLVEQCRVGQRLCGGVSHGCAIVAVASTEVVAFATLAARSEQEDGCEDI